MASIRKTTRNWIIGFALGFLLFSRVRSETSRVRSGLAWGTIAAVGSMFLARRTAKQAARIEAEAEDAETVTA